MNIDKKMKLSLIRETGKELKELETKVSNSNRKERAAEVAYYASSGKNNVKCFSLYLRARERRNAITQEFLKAKANHDKVVREFIR